jgi:hypothetical protein
MIAFVCLFVNPIPEDKDLIREGGTHSPGEWFDPTDAYLGGQRIFLTIIGPVGLEGVSDPLLPKRN